MDDRVVHDSMQLGSTTDQSVIRVTGRGTMRESPALRTAAEVALERGPLVIDMSACEYLDSTLLGCLIGIRKLAEQQKRQFDIVASESQQVKLFSTSSLDKYFDFVDEPPKVAGEWMEIEPENLDTEALSRHVLVCHERLADRGGTEGAVFRRVCDRLTTEIEQHEMDKALRTGNGHGHSKPSR